MQDLFLVIISIVVVFVVAYVYGYSLIAVKDALRSRQGDRIAASLIVLIVLSFLAYYTLNMLIPDVMKFFGI